MFTWEIGTREQQGNAVVGGGCRCRSARPCHCLRLHRCSTYLCTTPGGVRLCALRPRPRQNVEHRLSTNLQVHEPEKGSPNK